MNTEEDLIVRFILSNCAGKPDYTACFDRYHALWYYNKYAPIALLVVAIFLAAIFRKQLLNVFVSIAAMIVRRKRRLSSGIADIKSRIDAKANE